MLARSCLHTEPFFLKKKGKKGYYRLNNFVLKEMEKRERYSPSEGIGRTRISVVGSAQAGKEENLDREERTGRFQEYTTRADSQTKKDEKV